MLKVEFHCHTRYSKDSLTSLPALAAAARRAGLDRVIITDHNTTAGAVAAQAFDAQLFIIGEEIMTTSGELLAAFVQEPLPPGLPPQEAIRRLRRQGAFISVSHPFDIHRSGHWSPDALAEIAPLVDAIEVFNARCLDPNFNTLALAFARQHNLAGTVGSDAHAAFEVGRATLTLPNFSDADGLRQGIRQAQAVTRLSSPLVHFVSTWARLVKRARPAR